MGNVKYVEGFTAYVEDSMTEENTDKTLDCCIFILQSFLADPDATIAGIMKVIDPAITYTELANIIGCDRQTGFRRVKRFTAINPRFSEAIETYKQKDLYEVLIKRFTRLILTRKCKNVNARDISQILSLYRYPSISREILIDALISRKLIKPLIIDGKTTYKVRGCKSEKRKAKQRSS